LNTRTLRLGIADRHEKHKQKEETASMQVTLANVHKDSFLDKVADPNYAMPAGGFPRAK
jgi:hypothetical protein